MGVEQRLCEANMQVNLEVNKPFWSSSFSVEFEVRAELRQFYICDLAQICLEKLIPEAIFHEQQAFNLKGRDHALLPGATSRSNRDEIAFFAAHLLNQEQNICGEFQAQLQSEFSAYPDKLNILHTFSQHNRGEYPEGVNIQYMARLFPARIYNFRLGLEIFSSRFAVCMLGRTPLVTRRLMIDCSTEQLHLRIMAERLKQVDALPCKELPGFSRFLSGLSEATVNRLDLEALFLEKLNSART